jgi:hypothetical protein
MTQPHNSLLDSGACQVDACERQPPRDMDRYAVSGDLATRHGANGLMLVRPFPTVKRGGRGQFMMTVILDLWLICLGGGVVATPTEGGVAS